MPQDTSREELPFLPGCSEFRAPSMDAGLLRALFAPCEAPGEWKYKTPKFTNPKGPAGPQDGCWGKVFPQNRQDSAVPEPSTATFRPLQKAGLCQQHSRKNKESKAERICSAIISAGRN